MTDLLDVGIEDSETLDLALARVAVTNPRFAGGWSSVDTVFAL